MNEKELAFVFQLQDALTAQRHMLATLVAEVAMLTTDPDGFLARMKNDEEDVTVSALAGADTSQPINRQVYEGRDREIQEVFECSRLVLNLKKALRGG